MILKVFLFAVLVNLVSTTELLDDEYFNYQFIDLLEDLKSINTETSKISLTKRSIQEIDSLDPKSLENPIKNPTEDDARPLNPIRQARHHYWTRKRGWNSSDYDNNNYNTNYNFYYPDYNWMNWNYFNRFKRNVEMQNADKADNPPERGNTDEIVATADEERYGKRKHKLKRNNFVTMTQVLRPYPMGCCNIEEESAYSLMDNTVADTRKLCVMETKLKKKFHMRNNNFTQEEIDEEDFINVFSCQKLNRTKVEIVCVTDCIGKKFNIIDQDGKFNVSAAKQFMMEYYATAEWEIKKSDKIVEKCIKATSKRDSISVDNFGFKCNSHMAQFTYCVYKEFFMACPPDRIKNKKCAKLREKLSNSKNN